MRRLTFGVALALVATPAWAQQQLVLPPPGSGGYVVVPPSGSD
jgi:hypothetical protein